MAGQPGSPGAAPAAQGEAGTGSSGSVYVIPGTGGTSIGGYLELPTSKGDVSLNITCNYGAPGDNEAFFSANVPAVTTGAVLVTIAVDGRPVLAFKDLNYNSGGQDRAFADTSYQGTWPWHGVFTAVDQGGALTYWDVMATGSPTANCTIVVFAIGGAPGTVHHP